MAWEPTPYVVPPFLAAVMSVPLALETWRHREEPAAEPFLATVILLFAWSFVYGVQLGFDSLALQLFWQRFGLVLGGTIPLVWLLFCVRYAGVDEYLTRRTVALLALDPVVFAVLVWTNGSHHLVWTAAAAGRGPGVQLAFAVGYFIHIAVAYSYVAVGIGLLAWVATDSTTLHRKQAGVIVAGALLPFGANVAYTLGLSPVPGLDLTTFAFALSSSLFALALFRFDLLDIAPVARRRWIDQLGDGVVVVDDEARVVEVNDVAAAALDPTPEVGEPVAPSLPVEDPADAGGELVETEDADGDRRFYDLRYTSLTDRHDEPVGATVGLRDVTDRTEYERRLEVANRVLRHNFRNAMNVVQGHAASLAADLEDDAAERARTIERRADEVIELNEGIQQIAATLDRDEPDERVDAAAVVEQAVERVTDEYPEVDVAVDAPQTARACVVDGNLFYTAVDHLVENAAEYNDAEEPTVSVTVVRSAGRVAVRVADNGPGIPDEERRVVEGGSEGPLTHGSGVGLWLVSWVASASNGDLSFAANDPRGTVVTLDVPEAPPGEGAEREGATGAQGAAE